jgi:hypothetical protein
MILKTLSEQAVTDIDIFYNTGHPGVYSATYTPAGGTGSPVTVILDYNATDEGHGADDLAAVGILRVRSSETESVSQYDTFAIGSNIWEVAWAKKTADGLEWICDISKR